MFLPLVVSFFVLVSSEAAVRNRAFDRQVSTSSIAGTRGFINTNTTSKSSNNNSSADYFALTTDGRLERIQLVFPQNTQVQKEAPATDTAQFLLTPDGRLEKLEEEKNVQVVQYFRLSEDGRLQAIREEDIPVDAQEESGEYHVLLPTGSLQRVRFMTTTKDNLVSAKVQYQEVAPISGPVYQYASPLVRVV